MCDLNAPDHDVTAATYCSDLPIHVNTLAINIREVKDIRKYFKFHLYKNWSGTLVDEIRLLFSETCSPQIAIIHLLVGCSDIYSVADDLTNDECFPSNIIQSALIL